MDIKPLVEYIKQNRESLVIALENYRQDPVDTRNMFAEQGKEVTPSELKEFCDLLESLINTTVD